MLTMKLLKLNVGVLSPFTDSLFKICHVPNLTKFTSCVNSILLFSTGNRLFSFVFD